MTNTSQDLFAQICAKVSNKLYFEQLMNKQQQFFDIQPYKIDKLYAESAKKMYRQIYIKYQVTKELIPHGNIWHQNERKIFIWFIVCYFHQIGAQDPMEIEINWDELSNIFFYKSSTFLKFQFLNIIKLKKRILWTTEEDQLLTKATQQQGIGKWNQISKALFFNPSCQIFKSPKHCRQRWLNHLDKNKNKGKWTDDQDYKILVYVKENGKKWSKIVQVLNHTRTQHMIKNRFNSLLTKNRKNKKQKQSETISKIIKTLQKILQINPSIERPSHFSQHQSYSNSSQHSQNSQHEESSESLHQFQHSKQPANEINDQCRENKLKIKPKLSIDTKAGTELSSFQTVTLWQSFNSFYENFLSKTDQLSSFISNYPFVFTLSEPAQRDQQESLAQIQSVKPQSDQIALTKTVYKTRPVYIIQQNS